MFVQPNTTQPWIYGRFRVYMRVPKSVHPYFQPESEWNNMLVPEDSELYFDVEDMSNIPFGIRCKSYPSAHSLFYKPPFFIQFKNSLPAVPKNYFSFNQFYKPNNEQHIIALLEHNKDEDLILKYAPKVTIPYLTQSIALNKTLDFQIVDSENKLISFKDGCELYIVLSLQ